MSGPITVTHTPSQLPIRLLELTSCPKVQNSACETFFSGGDALPEIFSGLFSANIWNSVAAAKFGGAMC